MKSHYYILEIEGTQIYLWDSAVANQSTLNVLASGALSSISSHKKSHDAIREAARQVRADMKAALRLKKKAEKIPTENTVAK